MKAHRGQVSPYAGRWVARLGEKIIAHGGTPRQALLAAKASRFKENPRIEYVPMPVELAFSPLLETVRTHIPPQEEIYLVGGAVRDALLQRASNDLDFVTRDDPQTIARRLADRMGGAYFPLDVEHGIARIVLRLENGERAHLDFARLRGASIEADLGQRDFTINALAVSLKRPQEILDPTGGAPDLLARRLRACAPTSMQADPIRVVRGIRMAAAYNLTIQPETRAWMQAAIPLLKTVSAERRRDELLALLNAPRPATSVRALDMLGALPHLLPELSDLKGVRQSPPHIYDVWQHSLDTLAQLERLLGVLGPQHDEEASANLMLGLAVMRLGRYRQNLHRWLQTEIVPERQLRPLLFLAALYHDIGKPLAQTREEADGRIRFLKHEHIGAEIAQQRARALKLSNHEIHWLTTAIRHHMRPAMLSHEKTGPSRRAIYRFFRQTGEAGVGVVLLSLADLLATYAHTLPQERWARALDVSRSLLEAWWERREEQVAPQPLVTGSDLIQTFDLQPGPLIGQLLETVREAQASGEVTTRQHALDLIRQVLAESGR